MEQQQPKGKKVRVAPEFIPVLDAIKKHMEKYSYGILSVSYTDATKLLALKIEKAGGVEKFMERYRITLEP